MKFFTFNFVCLFVFLSKSYAFQSLVGTDFSNASSFQASGGQYDQESLDDLVPNDGVTVSLWQDFNSGGWQEQSDVSRGFTDSTEGFIARLDGGNNTTLQSIGGNISGSSQSGSYFEITVDGNTVLDLDSIEFEWRQATGNGTRHMTFGTSVTDTIIFKELGVLRDNTDIETITFSEVAYKGLTNTTVRFYFFAGEGTGTRDLEVDNIILYGTTTFEAIDDEAIVGIGNTVLVAPLTNDDGFPDTTTLAIVSQPTNGTASVQNGRILYTHTGTTTGTDQIVYQVSRINNNTFESANIDLTVTDELRLDPVTMDVPINPPGNADDSLIYEDAFPNLSFSEAVAMCIIPGQPNALLVASINGSVWCIPDTTVPNPTSHQVLDISSITNFANGRSIYSIRCFPDYETSGNIIINYQGDSTRLPEPAAGQTIHDVIPNIDVNGALDNSADAITCDLRVSRFTLPASHLADVVNNGLSTEANEDVLETEFPYINMAEQYRFHSINDVHFGSDGYLYISFGDEGLQNDGNQNSQTLTKDLFSSIIRIDIDPNSTNPKPNAHYAVCVGPLDENGKTGFFTDPANQEPNFRVPADNPFIHTSLGGTWAGDLNSQDLSGQLDQVRTEIWALGLRNPFKFHLETDESTGEVIAWVGDVGHQTNEEFSVLKSGDNAGWGYWEGLHQIGLSHTTPPSGSTPHKTPLFAYDRATGTSATGGIVYHNTELSELTGKYICADYISGRIWALSENEPPELLSISGNGIVDFELDQVTGDIYTLEHGSGKIRRITLSVGEPLEYPETLTETGLFANLEDLSPNPGVIPYEPNLTFWSDDADKKRWMAIPGLSNTITFNGEEQWDFPVGQVWVKHFDYDLDRSNPGTSVKRLETRILVENGADSYGVSYRWNNEGSEAFLVGQTGDDFVINYTDASGNPASLDWHIPSHSECLRCHTDQAGVGLSMNTRQMNREYTIGHITGNQLTLLVDSGYLTGFTGTPQDYHRHSNPTDTNVNLEDRARAYLDVNCAYCHQDGGATTTNWDARASISLEQTGLLYGSPVSESQPNPTDHLVRPGNTVHSAIWNRISARTAINGNSNGYTQMPPLASNLFDEEGIALITEWINNYANVAPEAVEDSLTDASISENSGLADSVGISNSADPDVRANVADQNNLTYAIIAGNGNNQFSIDAATGEISVNGLLDFETSISHILTVEVSDNFAPNPMVEIRTVIVQILDETINDATLDEDGNGIYDAWESIHGFTAVDPDSDSDNDGTSAFFEFLSGGDPNTEDTSLDISIDTTTETGGVGMASDSEISWFVRNGFIIETHYDIQTNLNLDGGWTTLTNQTDYEVIRSEDIGQGVSRLYINVPESDLKRFYRLISK